MLTTRLVTAAVLLPLFIVALLFLPNRYWGLFLLPALLIASMEWAALAAYRRPGQWIFVTISLICGYALFYGLNPITETLPGGTARYAAVVYWISVAFWILVVPLWLAGKWQPRNPLALGIAGLIVLVPTWLALATLQASPVVLLMLLGVIWVADSAGYLVGRRLGRHRLAPSISPGKTWEGVGGAAVAVAVYYSILWIMFGPQPPLLQGFVGPALVAILTIMSIEGDLFESWMKRTAGVKDSGRLLPGHGGVLDRIDALTSSMPAAALWLHYSG